MTAIVSVKNLIKKYGTKPILQDISFDVQTGHVVGLMGPNGAGKTTLMKVLMGMMPVNSGKIWICGRAAGSAARAYISYMPDKNHLFSWMRIQDAVQYYRDMFQDFDIQQAAELCAFLKLDVREKIGRLSKGNLLRTRIMLTFSRKASLYLLDEPIGGIDPLGRDKIMKTIFNGLGRESSTIISTHLVKDVEMLLDDVLFLNEGELIYNNSADGIREERGTSIEACYLEVFNHA